MIKKALVIEDGWGWGEVLSDCLVFYDDDSILLKPMDNERNETIILDYDEFEAIADFLGYDIALKELKDALPDEES